MASCSVCGKEQSCACQLISNKCTSCYAKDYGEGNPPPVQKRTSRITYQNTSEPEPLNEFSQILRQKELTKEQKLQRINNILEQNRKKHDNQL